MTLHIAFFTGDHLIQASDRLLTVNNIPVNQNDKVIFFANGPWNLLISIAGCVNVSDGSFELLESLRQLLINQFPSRNRIEDLQPLVRYLGSEIEKQIHENLTAKRLIKSFEVLGLGYFGFRPIGFQMIYSKEKMEYEFRDINSSSIFWAGDISWFSGLRAMADLRERKLEAFPILGRILKEFKKAAKASPNIGKDIMSFVLLPKSKELVVGYEQYRGVDEVIMPIIISEGVEVPASRLKVLLPISENPGPDITCPCGSDRLYSQCHGDEGQNEVGKAIFRWGPQSILQG